MANPLSAYLRVPFMWYRSIINPLHSFETASMIRRRYDYQFDDSDLEGHRYFCGLCGTPIAYHSEEPEESDYIMITLGSLDPQDLRDLEAMGLIPTEESVESGIFAEAGKPAVAATPEATDTSIDDALQILAGIPWFDSLVEGSILGRLTRTPKSEVVVPRDHTKVIIQWEITEFEDEESEEVKDVDVKTATLFGKRKLRDFVEEMEKELGF